MNIELLSRDNLEQLINLVLEFWDDCDFDEEFRAYEKMINSEEQVIFLCKDISGYNAFLHATIRNDYVEGANTSRVAYLEAIYVRPLYRKKGIARSLINQAEEWARTRGLKQIGSDTVITNTESISFHEEIGFKEVERIVCYIKDL